MRRQIRTMLRDWHEDVVDGDMSAAWDLLTARKRAQSLQKYGYAGWERNQASLRRYLDPSGLDVTVLDVDPATRVATVDVTGMSWSKPGARCGEWSGITWVRWEQGGWHYDPGYSTTPEREREWKPRFSELLGGSC
jgi:hypothetical protein